MSDALLVLAVAFSAACVWLTVRIVNRRERWAKCTLAAVVGVPVLYVASFGPAFWLSGRRYIEPAYVGWLYQPILRLYVQPGRLRNAIRWYALLGAQYRPRFIFEDDPLERMARKR
jgi:hypothetical protein